MADKDGRLSDEDVEKLVKWLGEKKVKDCPRCGKEEYIVNTHLMKIMSSGGTYFPAVLVHCSNCTFTSIFAANLIGISQDTEDKESGNG